MMSENTAVKNDNLTKDVLDVEDLQQILPHRPPMLLIEKMIDIVPGESATGIKSVSVNEPYFEGHFPQQRIMPGVLIVEALAQTAGALVLHTLQKKDCLVYFMSIESARFRKPVVPGDQLEMKVEKLQQRGGIWKFSGKAYVKGVLHAEANYTAMIVENES